MANPDGFTRTVDTIDRELHEQWMRRENGIAEILHGCFQTERATTAIDRLIDERARAASHEGATA